MTSSYRNAEDHAKKDFTKTRHTETIMPQGKAETSSYVKTSQREEWYNYVR